MAIDIPPTTIKAATKISFISINKNKKRKMMKFTFAAACMLAACNAQATVDLIPADSDWHVSTSSAKWQTTDEGKKQIVFSHNLD